MMLATAATLVETYLDGLPAKLAAAKDEAAVVALAKAAPADVKVSQFPSSDGHLRVTLQFPAVAAATLVHDWKLARPYAIAVDVHQQTWEIGLWQQDVPDPYGKRIATKAVAYGAWTVEVRLAGRPEGALPKVSAGASPAYDLNAYAAKVTSVTIELTKP